MAGLKNKFAYQFLISATQVLLPLFTYPYITRILGPEKLGIVNYADFVSQIFIALAAFGIPLYAIRETAMLRNDKRKRALLVKELSIIYTFLSFLFAIIFLLLMYKKLVQHTSLYLLAAANILISAVSFNWYIQGMEYFKLAAVRDLFIKAAMLLCFYLFVKNSNDNAIFFGIFTAGLLATAIVNTTAVIKENSNTAGKTDIKKHLSPLFHFFLLSSAISIYEYFDTIILDHVTKNAEQVGYYTTMLKMIRIVTTTILMAGTVMLPRISFLVAQGNKDEVKRYLEKFLGFVMIAGVPVAAGIFIFAPEIIQTIAGVKFLPAVPLLQVLGFLPLVIGVSNVFCYQILVPFKQEKKFLLTALAGCVTSIGLNFLLVPKFLALGSAWATLITEIVVLVMGLLLANKMMQLQFPLKSTLQSVIISALFYPAALICRSTFGSALLIFLAGALLCSLIYILAQVFLFKNNNVKEITGYLKNTINAAE